MSSDCDLSHYYNLVDDIRISEESSTKILDLFQRQYKPTSTVHFYLSSLSFFVFHFSFFTGKVGWIESDELKNIIREYGEAMNNNIQISTDSTEDLNTEGTELFINVVKSVSILYNEINTQRDELEKNIQSHFLKPIKTFLTDSVSRFNEEKQRFEKVRKEHDQSVLKVKQFEGQYSSPQQQRQIDAEKIILVEQEYNRNDAKYKSMLWESIQGAELVVLERNVNMLNAFRNLLMAELSYHRFAEKIITDSSELLARVGDYWNAKKDIPEEQRKTRESRRAEYEKAEDALRHEKLSSFVEKYSDILTGTEIEVNCKPHADNFLTSAVNIIDAHNLIVDKLKQEITSTIANNDDKSLTSNTVDKQPQEKCESNDEPASKALFSLRATTSLTRTLTCYSKKCCDKWMNSIFAGTLKEILSQGSALEIDKKFIEPSSEKTVNELYKENKERFITLCQSLLDKIRGSTKTFPIQVRELARHMRSEITKVDGAMAGNLSLSGFIFLRLICPFITSFVTRVDKAPARRTLLNTAKMLQAISNEAMSSVNEIKYKAFMDLIRENKILVYKWYDDLTVKK